MHEGVLTVSHVSKEIQGRKIVNDCSLSVQSGEVVGILGPNGAGKTTLFSLICGLVPLDSGKIFLDQHDVTALPSYRRARMGLGYLPQEPSVFRGMTVEKNILAVLELFEPSPVDRKQQLETLLTEFNLHPVRKSMAISLSGGERRRVEVARIVAAHPNYVLLDEPLAGIDPVSVGDIRRLIRQLKERSIGVLITDHNVRETLDIVDRAYIMSNGSVLMEGTPQEIVANKRVREIYLGESFSL